MAQPRNYAKETGACLSCRWAAWRDLNKNGAPKRDTLGDCMWPVPELKLPVCMVQDFRRTCIWREQADHCPTWEPKD